MNKIKVTSLFHLICLFNDKVQTLYFSIEQSNGSLSDEFSIRYEQHTFELNEGIIVESEFMGFTASGHAIYQDKLWYLPKTN